MTLRQGDLAQKRVSSAMIRVGEQVVHGKPSRRKVITGDNAFGPCRVDMFAAMQPRKKEAIRSISPDKHSFVSGELAGLSACPARLA